jgi:hypothetical protein
MKNPSLIIVPALLLACMPTFLTGCASNDIITGTDQIVGSGRIVTESRSVPPFAGIRITNYAKVLLTQDTVESLRIDADDNILGRIQTQVIGGVLVAGLPEGSYNNITVILHASMRTIALLESTGAADFSATAPISTNDLLCRITGTGSIALSGTAGRETIEITGAGNVRNFGLVANRCSALISGAGAIEVTVSQQLDATILGTGSITYAGNPPVANTSVLGVGTIRPAE